ncbi:MAG: hypothetical protein JWR03_1160 [Cohnella sp.]|nr:hypothetical protein [Cohnella sp.]
MSTGKNSGASRRVAGSAAMLLLAMMLTIAACSNAKSAHDAGAPAAMSQADMASTALQDNAKVHDAAKNSVSSSSSSAQGQTTSKLAAVGGTGFVPMAEADTGINRKVIYKAQVTMKVPKFEPADEQLSNAIHQSGAYVLQFSNSMDANEKGATYVIKVPADGFSSFIDQLRKIQKDLELQMEGSDVTEEYVDLTARLAAKKTVEARLLAFMDKAKGSDDLVKFSSELANVQEQIEQIKGRMRYLDQNVAYSTVNLRLYEGTADTVVKENNDQGLGERLAGALTGSAHVLGQFGQALLVFIAALLPVVAVAAVVGIPVYVIIQGRRRAHPRTSAEGPLTDQRKTDDESR